jgi:4-amino-4-deoxychorismate lyase
LKLKCNAGKYEHYKQYKAMYSSVLEGITTDPAMMLIPLDDHMVHRGHGVFDTALIIEGYVSFVAQLLVLKTLNICVS